MSFPLSYKYVANLVVNQYSPNSIPHRSIIEVPEPVITFPGSEEQAVLR